MKAEPFFGTHQYVSEVNAFYHSSFEAIHPFLDENGRAGRIIMHRQMQLGLGLKQEANMSSWSPLPVKNPYGAGSKHESDSPNNPYGQGWAIVGE